MVKDYEVYVEQGTIFLDSTDRDRPMFRYFTPDEADDLAAELKVAAKNARKNFKQ